MGKLAKFALMGLFRSAFHDSEVENFFLMLIFAIFVILFGAFITACIARLIGKDFDEWFVKSVFVWIFLGLICGIIIMCS